MSGFCYSRPMFDRVFRQAKLMYRMMGRIGVDLEAQTITSPSGKQHRFEIDPRRRAGLLEGLDEILLTLRRDDEIRAFQASDRDQRPWIHFAGKQA